MRRVPPTTKAERRTSREKGPTSRHRVSLSRARIVKTAIKMLESDSERTLTIRQIASELDVSPMALYKYFRDKDEMLRDVLDTIYAQRKPVKIDPSDWCEWLREWARTVRQFALEHRNQMRFLFTPPIITPSGLHTVEDSLDVLIAAGFPKENAARAVTQIHSFTSSTVLWEIWRREYALASGLGPDYDGYWAIDFRSFDSEEFPHLVELADVMEMSHDDLFEEGLERVLVAIRDQLAPPSAQQKPDKRQEPGKRKERGKRKESGKRKELGKRPPPRARADGTAKGRK